MSDRPADPNVETTIEEWPRQPLYERFELARKVLYYHGLISEAENKLVRKRLEKKIARSKR